MGTSEILLGGNPVIGHHPIQGGVAILLGMLHANETRISSSCLGLWLLCTLTFTLTLGKHPCRVVLSASPSPHVIKKFCFAFDKLKELGKEQMKFETAWIHFHYCCHCLSSLMSEGAWWVEPLVPAVHNNFENNLWSGGPSSFFSLRKPDCRLF